MNSHQHKKLSKLTIEAINEGITQSNVPNELKEAVLQCTRLTDKVAKLEQELTLLKRDN